MKFHIRTFLESELVGYQQLDDPFVVNITKISWMDRFKSLFKKYMEITVRVDGDPEAIRAVMNAINPDDKWPVFDADHRANSDVSAYGTEARDQSK